MPLMEAEMAPDFDALLCDGETFRTRSLEEVGGPRGTVLIFDGFVFSAIAENWWNRYESLGWAEFDDVPVYGIVRDGPYSINEFLRQLASPFSLFSDLNGSVASDYDLLTARDGMAGIETPRRAVIVLDADREITHLWIADDWISPVPTSEVEAAVSSL